MEPTPNKLSAPVKETEYSLAYASLSSAVTGLDELVNIAYKEFSPVLRQEPEADKKAVEVSRGYSSPIANALNEQVEAICRVNNRIRSLIDLGEI